MRIPPVTKAMMDAVQVVMGRWWRLSKKELGVSGVKPRPPISSSTIMKQMSDKRLAEVGKAARAGNAARLLATILLEEGIAMPELGKILALGIARDGDDYQALATELMGLFQVNSLDKHHPTAEEVELLQEFLPQMDQFMVLLKQNLKTPEDRRDFVSMFR